MDNNRSIIALTIGGRAPRGFSLVELMIVIALVGLLAALSAPTISNSMEQNRIADLNRAVGNGFLQARQYAMRQNQAVFVDVQTGTDGSITFYNPQNRQNAQSCALADDGGATDQNTLNEINLIEYGLDIRIDSVDPINGVCIAPNGRVLQPTGIPIEDEVAGDGCERMNLMIRLIGEDEDLGSLHDCTADDDLSIERELANFSMIHVGYGGQVRIIR